MSSSLNERITAMFDTILPKSIDNTYRGQKLALWLLGLLALINFVIGTNSIVNGRAVLTAADGVPVDTYPAAAAQAIVALWALLGLSRLVIGLLFVLALIRYRNMVPFLFVLLLLQNLSGRLILHFLPLVRTGTPTASVINLTLLTLMIVGLGLSLWRRR
jgi:hypothetical protein